MRRSYAALLLLAACSPAPDVDARLLARRAALGLGSGPLAFPEAMQRKGAKAYEALLARVGSRRLPADEVLDAALELENLLARADVATAGAVRDADPRGFDGRLEASRDRALDLARAIAAGGSGEKEARVLLMSCMECHLMFRKPK